MKHYSSTFFRLFLFLIPVSIWAQELPEIVPPSPEAAALGNFVDVPISHYTGLPNISVPIYTIKQKGISIPIQLSYHARGVKVAEVAPRTGMGWSLQYGGSVTRQVRGKSDEFSINGYLNNGSAFTDYASDQDVRASVHGIETNYPDYDFYPDQFNFSAGSISGKFILDYTTGDPIIQSFDDVKIEYSMGGGSNSVAPSGINGFVITDSDGTKYYFGKTKQGNRFAGDYQDSGGMSVYFNGDVVLDYSEAIDRYYSSWKLVEIETIYGEKINYYYEGEHGVNSASHYYRKAYDKHTAPQGSNVVNTAAGMNDITTMHTRLSLVRNYEKQLKKITFNNERDSIIFTKSQNWRQDFEGFSLDKISIYHKAQHIKSYHLNYTYTTSTDTSNLLWYYNDPGNSNFTRSWSRMFLSSVQEEGANGVTKPPYTFTYDSTVLPSTYSSRQDYWGYYNAAPNNGPFTRMFTYGMYEPDRRVNIDASEAGLLKEIQYPTGGKTLLTYEHNIGKVPEEFNSVIVPNINPGSVDETTIELTKSDFSFNQGLYTPYTLQLPSGTPVTYSIECFHLQDINNPLPEGVNCLFYFTVNGGEISLDQPTTIYTGTDTSATIQVFPINHPEIPSNQHLDNIYNFRIVIDYDTPDQRTNLYGPGKRIKRIDNIDLLGNTITKEYEYKYSVVDPTNGNVSYKDSGAIIGLPSYLNTSPGFAPNYFTTVTDYNDAGAMFGSFQPNTIGYSGVIEYLGTKYDNVGKTEYTFTNIGDTGGDYFKFPYHPPTDNEWLRGKNVRTKVFKNENNNYTLVKEIYNKYLYGGTEYASDFEYAGLLNPDFEFTPQAIYLDWEQNTNEEPDWIENDKPAGYVNDRTLFKLPLYMLQRMPVGDPNINPVTFHPGYRIYHLTGGTQHLLRTTEKDYLDNGTLEKTTTYGYNYDEHYQTKTVTSVTSDGKDVKQEFHYPQDLLNAYTPTENGIVQNLIDQNRIAPLETKTFKDTDGDGLIDTNEVMNSSRTKYDWLDGVLEPSLIQTAKGTNPLENRIRFKKYDADGNILHVSREDGMDICYIYGYDKSLPVAKIENATYSQVAGFVNSIQNASDFDTSSCMSSQACNENTLRNAQNNLRQALPLAMVTTYTYDPLIGVTSMTDPKGYTVYYEYDDLHRLVRVKDQDGKILSENKYHYLLD
ncbi:RHS repeat domain-containing protein [uncultured Psychroserpens sp.]|uniref:RHS repeat domain-containing protein n=1 Tax=uncultured Psychroserpens sp. TaxID=255436 RepID=UPI00260DECFE|nr:RHS repeat domain-containing protein [uncultured Psychroserpens sp.]